MNFSIQLINWWIYTSKQTFEKHVNLLLSNSKKSKNYVLIKDSDRFLTNKTKYHGKKHFYRYCLQSFSSLKVLEFHAKNCVVINHTKSVLLPEEDACIIFQNCKRLTRAPFIIYGNFECVLITSIDNIDVGPNTKKYQYHIIWSYGYKLICVDEWYNKLYKTYFGEDSIGKFLNDMIKKWILF